MPTLYDNIPLELRELKQFVLWKAVERDGKLTKIPITCQGKPASVNDASTWCDFDCAVNNVDIASGIGFVFTANDPYCGIDLDHTDDPVELNRQIAIYNAFDSYTERSPSGKGAHIIIKGNIGTGARRKPLEVYSQQRYFTMTGDCIRPSPIREYQELITTLRDEIKQAGEDAKEREAMAESAAQSREDEQVLSTAQNAANADKFNQLWQGDWQSLYGSQSEADLSLVNMLAYYTQNHDQIARIFRQSALGQRPKAKRDGYIYGELISKALDRELPTIDLSAMAASWQSGATEADGDTTAAPESAVTIALQHPLEEMASRFKFEPPSGLVGDIAQFIYAQAPRPVPEIALAGAIALMAGICGQAYNVSNTGLNQYILVLAGTGTGKEGAASGISKIMHEVTKTVPVASEFMGPSNVASAQSLVKYMSDNRGSMLSIVGEFGLRLQQLSHVKANPNDIMLRSAFLDFYNKSGANQYILPYIYSDKANNTAALWAPNFSMLGESTPSTFYEALNHSMIADGFLPRFTIIEYLGKRPALNKGHKAALPSEGLISRVASLAAGCKTMMQQRVPTEITLTNEAEALADAINTFADDKINADDADELIKHLWNRVHVKALKMAGLIAVGIHPVEPVITLPVMEWACSLAIRDAMALSAKFASGDTGLTSTVTGNEQKQINEIIRVIADYVGNSYSRYSKYGGTPEMHAAKVIAHEHIQRRVINLKCFTGDMRGANIAIKKAMETLCDWEYIKEVSRTQMQSEFHNGKKSYVVADPSKFNP